MAYTCTADTCTASDAGTLNTFTMLQRYANNVVGQSPLDSSLQVQESGDIGPYTTALINAVAAWVPPEYNVPALSLMYDADAASIAANAENLGTQLAIVYQQQIAGTNAPNIDIPESDALVFTSVNPATGKPSDAPIQRNGISAIFTAVEAKQALVEWGIVLALAGAGYWYYTKKWKPKHGGE